MIISRYLLIFYIIPSAYITYLDSTVIDIEKYLNISWIILQYYFDPPLTKTDCDVNNQKNFFLEVKKIIYDWFQLFC